MRLLPPAERPRRRAQDFPFLRELPVGGRSSADRVLVRAASLGDEEAWQRLVDAYAGWVWTWSRAACEDETAARAVSEVAWLRLAQALPRFGRGPVGPWLQQAVRSEAERATLSARARSRSRS